VHDSEPSGRHSSAANPLTWQQARQAAWSADLAGPPTEVVIRAVVVTCVAFAVAGVLAAWLWAQLADPPSFQVLAQKSAIMDEEESARQFGVDLTYATIALALAVPLGLVTGWRWHRVGWPQVVAVAGGAGIAAVVAWQLGTVLGPDEPGSLVDSAQVGDLLPEQLDVHATGMLLVWPVGALVGLIVAVLVFSRPSTPRPYHARVGDPPPWRQGPADPDPG
jgi:hypothetical protein